MWKKESGLRNLRTSFKVCDDDVGQVQEVDAVEEHRSHVGDGDDHVNAPEGLVHAHEVRAPAQVAQLVLADLVADAGGLLDGSLRVRQPDERGGEEESNRQLDDKGQGQGNHLEFEQKVLVSAGRI